jgi:8-oxo-dGTP diphosphatase
MPAMGWQQFAAMLEHIAIPVYALGGLTEKDMKVARQHGAQGIAAISAFWND